MNNLVTNSDSESTIVGVLNAGKTPPPRARLTLLPGLM